MHTQAVKDKCGLANKNHFWIHNAKIELRIAPGYAVPSGFELGRRTKIKAKISKKVTQLWSDGRYTQAWGRPMPVQHPAILELVERYRAEQDPFEKVRLKMEIQYKRKILVIPARRSAVLVDKNPQS